MFEEILPPGVAVSEIFGPFDSCTLAPEEQNAVAGAVHKRQAEFAAGRTCARRAMAKLGVSIPALLLGANREPVWPRGIVESITHCSGYSAAQCRPAL